LNYRKSVIVSKQTRCRFTQWYTSLVLCTMSHSKNK